MSERFDLIVAGAGPAGLTAALEAARAGCRVLLVEKFGKIAPVINCAEGVTTGSIASLIGIRSEWILSRIERGVLVSPSGLRFELEHPNAGYILDRVRMQRDLADSFVTEGGELRTGHQAVGLNRNGDRFNEMLILNADTEQTSAVGAEIFIDAEGVEGKLARMAGIDNRLELAHSESYLQYRLRGVSFDPNGVELYVGQEVAPRSYVWVFPHGQGEVTVGLGASSDSDNKPGPLLDRFVDVRFPGAERVNTACGTSPRYQSPRAMASDNLLVVGDAARLLDSATGAGIALAIKSGQLAGRAAAEFCKGRASSLKKLYNIYPGEFVRDKHQLLTDYRKVKVFLDKLSDRELDGIVEGLNEIMGRKKVDSVNALELFLKVIRKRPRLLALARHFF